LPVCDEKEDEERNNGNGESYKDQDIVAVFDHSMEDVRELHLQKRLGTISSTCFYFSLVSYFALLNWNQIAGFLVAIPIFAIGIYRIRKIAREFKTSSEAKSVPVPPHTAVTTAGIRHVVVEPRTEDGTPEKTSVYEIPFSDITSIKIGPAIVTKNICKVDIGLISADRDSYIQSGCPDLIQNPILTRMTTGMGRTVGTNLCLVALEEPYQFKRLVLARSHLPSSTLEETSKEL
jgi:hypothetical protein